MRQHANPLLLPLGGATAILLKPISQNAGVANVSEAAIQALVQAHPDCLPIAEIDSIFVDPVPICTELNTPAGPIDNLMITASGLPVLVECKLWRNPEARREVVGQILDYAKELSRWSSSDLQREVSRRVSAKRNPIFERIQERYPDLDEIQFNDALTANLRRGRFLLLIVGDGIREGVEAIAEYIQAHAGLHFTLGLVELPMYEMPDGSRIVAPRILAHTTLITRNVLAMPDGYAIEEPAEAGGNREVDPARRIAGDELRAFWSEFLGYLKLDDPDQPRPNPARLGYISLSLPAPTSWLTIFRDMRIGEVGVFLSYWKGSAGEFAVRAVVDEWDTVRAELNGGVKLLEREGRPHMIDARAFGSLDDPSIRKQAFTWLAERVNTFVNVLRPRIRSAAADYEARRGSV